jgi:hypothetical protein
MRKNLFYVLFLLACLLGQSAEAKVKQKPVYLFGFATSFVDSLAYVTDVQYMDSSYVETKTKFLVGRNIYSIQLQQFLMKNEGCKHPVTSIFFGKKKEKVEKLRQSVIRRYEGDYTLKTVTCPFQTENYVDQEVKDIPDAAADKKPGKKSKKK